MLTKKHAWEIEWELENTKDSNLDKEWYPADEVDKQFELLKENMIKSSFIEHLKPLQIEELWFIVEKAQRGELK